MLSWRSVWSLPLASLVRTATAVWSKAPCLRAFQTRWKSSTASSRFGYLAANGRDRRLVGGVAPDGGGQSDGQEPSALRVRGVHAWPLWNLHMLREKGYNVAPGQCKSASMTGVAADLASQAMARG